MNLPVGMPVLSRKNGYNAFTFQNGELLGGSSTHFKSLFCSELQINKKNLNIVIEVPWMMNGSNSSQ
jgi:hypothetical protein